MFDLKSLIVVLCQNPQMFIMFTRSHSMPSSQDYLLIMMEREREQINLYPEWNSGLTDNVRD